MTGLSRTAELSAGHNPTVADWLAYPVLVAAGVVAGTINVLAGGGSFLTLPLLIFLGLPATVANGTNRIGVVMQNVSGVWAFHRHGVLDWRWALVVGIPGGVGAIVGAYAALSISDEAFRRILATVMVLISLWTLLGHAAVPRGTTRSGTSVPVVLGFLLIGLYAGFIQAGVGFLILAVTTLAGFDLVRGNAVKLLSVLVFTLISLAIFAANAGVDWPMGIALGVGNAIGGAIGVRIAMKKGHAWLRMVVTATVIVFAIKLWFF